MLRDAYEQVRAVQSALIQPDQILLQLAGGFNGGLQWRIVAAAVEQNQEPGPPTSGRPGNTEQCQTGVCSERFSAFLAMTTSEHSDATGDIGSRPGSTERSWGASLRSPGSNLGKSAE